ARRGQPRRAPPRPQLRPARIDLPQAHANQGRPSMRATLLIARREIGAYLRSMIGYVIIAGVLAIDGLLFNAYALGGADKRSSEVLSLFFYFGSGITMASSVFIP